ncbi:phosphate ABC transporter permease PstA [Mycoplasma bradburyae]|uniref:phosphate ABC transporter permease PstA n=1 Tax=Mycoplasma bradburyae TaxID=2963128 RepID=UPI002341A122|nr:phosphate ABC transporter permease PstA [Mycoplasma bradburyae]MDC4182573.1 phosphate ABC transporter permease PstA [Mycoplasma bradburyae]
MTDTFKFNQFKNIRSKTFQIIAFTTAWLFAFIFVGIFSFIFYKSIPGWQSYGSSIFKLDFNLVQEKAGVWAPLSVTLFVTFLSLLIASPIGINTAIFIKFRLKKKLTKIFRITINILAGIPSVVFGLFAANSLGFLVQFIFKTKTSWNLITAIIMLTFMIIPTIVAMSYNSLESVDINLLSASIALGTTKTKSIYKIFKKEAKNGIYVSLLTALSRAISESMALNFILTSQNYNIISNSNFSEFIQSGLKTIGAIISYNFFAENGSENLRSVLYLFGIVLFIFTIIINIFVLFINRSSTKKKYPWVIKIETFLANVILFIPYRISKSFIYFISLNKRWDSFFKLHKNNIKIKIYDGWKLAIEFLCIGICISFIVWIIIYTFYHGFIAIFSPEQTITSFEANSTGRATINTLVIIFFGILISFPVSLFVAIYINEYAKNKKVKRIILFFIDALGSTPSILFGIFGLTFFIQTLGLAIGGKSSNSIFAGILTISLVIIPSFIRMLQQALSSVPNSIREASYALGISRSQTILKIILPQVTEDILSSIILTISRILAETAPLYITAGLSSSNHFSLGLWGQTLTVRIYSQLFSTKANAQNIMFESAFMSILLIFIFIIISNLLIPYIFKNKYKLMIWIDNLKSRKKNKKRLNNA